MNAQCDEALVPYQETIIKVYTLYFIIHRLTLRSRTTLSGWR